MAFNDEFMKGMSAIYKYLFENKQVQRNVLRKQMLNKGKIASKEKFTKIIEGLIALDKIKANKDELSLNPEIITTGVLMRTNNNEYYITTPASKNKYKVDKSIASGYQINDTLDVVLEFTGAEYKAILLGKSEKSVDKTKEPAKKTVQIESTYESKTEPNNKNMVLGRVIKLSHDELVFIPNRKDIRLRHIPITNSKEEMASFQDKICVMEMNSIDSPTFGGRIVAVKGDAGNPIHEYDVIAENYGAIMDWDDPALAPEIEKIPTSVDANALDLISEKEAQYNQKGKVVDLRHIPFATVDPATCKDMDDAIYSTIDENGDIVCYTAVANVTKYVDLDSEIGKRYVEGSFTIYAPNRAYNILPTKLSTGICSLNPNEDRLAFVVKTVIDRKTGMAKESKIYDAVIRSRHKYSYEQAQALVDALDCEATKSNIEYKLMTGKTLSDEEQVLMNYYSALHIQKGFEKRQMIRFNANREREIVFDEDLADVVDIRIIPHLKYHEVIEAFMITANEATAKFASEHNLNNIYRTHSAPKYSKLERAAEFFDILHLDFNGDLSAEETRNIIDSIKGSSVEEVVNKFLIKMQSKAVYSDELYPNQEDSYEYEDEESKISHFALQSPHYSHTTSPIRRLPDYITQYNILAYIHQTKPLFFGTIMSAVEQANIREREVDHAENEFEDISSVIYCEKHIGEKMRGMITKLRYTDVDEDYYEPIVVIAKNEEHGINVEIPLSQIIGNSAYSCSLSDQGCAVYNKKGKIVLTLCKSIDFVITGADRRTMTVTGSANKELISEIAKQKLQAKAPATVEDQEKEME